PAADGTAAGDDRGADADAEADGPAGPPASAERVWKSWATAFRNAMRWLLEVCVSVASESTSVASGAARPSARLVSTGGADVPTSADAGSCPNVSVVPS